MDIQTCLQVLELEAPLTPVRIRRAYRRMVKRWHPDQFALEPSMLTLAEERLKSINAAYAKLKAAYDKVQAKVPGRTENIQRPFNWHFSTRLRSTLRADSGKRRTDPNKRQASRSIRKDQVYSGHASAANRQKPAPARPESQFERILREKSPDDAALFNPRNSGANQPYRWRPARCRRGALRVNGFLPASPWQPIRPVSKISPIEGSD